MKRFLIAGALALAAFTLGTLGQAAAADLPQPAPPPPQAPVAYIPTIAPVYNWGGIYWGINGGYGFGKSDWTVPTATTGNFSLSGGLIGGTLGFNYQMDAFVAGIEGDIDYSGIDGNSSSCTPAACETKNTWLGTARLRLGYAADRVLFYGTVGGAFGNIEANSTTTFQSASKAGWVAGAGLEAAFADNWTARIEYLFVDLQNASLATTTPGVNTTVTFDGSLVRAGLVYKFR